MYRRCTLEKASQTQRKYIKCLLRLMREKPYTDITINDICEQMGTSRKSFYHFFESKLGCIYAMCDRLIFEFEEYQPDEPVDLKGYPRRLIYHLLYQLEGRDLFESLIRNDLFGILIERLVVWIRQSVANSNLYDAYMEDAILFYTFGVMAVCYKWHESGYERSVYEVAESISRLATQEILENWY